MGEERINPIKLRDKKSGESYELDFSREAVFLMDREGFKVGDVGDFPASNVPKLFYYSFRKNHRKMTKAQTDHILYDVLHGLTSAMLERLIALYVQAATSNSIQDEEDLEKNADVEVEL